MTQAFRGVAAAALLAALALGAAPASAHHSGAMYDQGKTVALTGAIKDFHWMNPHAVVELVTKDASGAEVIWNFECSTPNILVRAGWTGKSLKAGDKVTVQMHPMKDGGKAGLILAVTTPQGQVLKDHGFVG
jgi:hypothetical protein